MKHFSAQTIFAIVTLIGLSTVSCSDSDNQKTTTGVRSKVDEGTQTRVVLADGVYPVAIADAVITKGDVETSVVELISVPVEGSEDSKPEKIRIIPQPLFRFQKVSHFDFTIEKNECTEVSFQNTDELKAYTRNHVGSRLAIVIDNKVVSHHKVREAIETDALRMTCCTVGGGDDLHKHLKELKFASNAGDPK